MKRMNWKTAKTCADAPHEYVLANEHPETYRRFSQLLKQAGVMESFTLRGKTAKYRYYYAVGGLLRRSKVRSARPANVLAATAPASLVVCDKV